MLRASCVLLLTLCSALYASADEVDGIYRDMTTCDTHGDRSATEELGNPSVFSFGQQIDHVSTFTDVDRMPASGQSQSGKRDCGDDQPHGAELDRLVLRRRPRDGVLECGRFCRCRG